MQGALIAFSVPTGGDRTRSSAFAKSFYGQETSSHHGRYRYHRRGLLDEVPHVKLIRGVIIVRLVDLDRVRGFLREHSAKCYVRVVELEEEDRVALGLPLE